MLQTADGVGVVGDAAAELVTREGKWESVKMVVGQVPACPPSPPLVKNYFILLNSSFQFRVSI